MQNKKSIIIGVACGIGVFALLVVFGSFVGANSLKGDFMDRLFGVFSKQEITEEKETMTEEPKTYTENEIMEMAEQDKGINFLTGWIEEKFGTGMKESLYNLKIKASPDSGSYGTAQVVEFSPYFVDGNGDPVPYTAPVSLYYDNLDDDINGFLPYSQTYQPSSVVVKENRNNGDPHQNRITVIGVYTGGVGLGYANYTIKDSVLPEVESAVYYEEYGHIRVQFNEIMNYWADLSPDQLQNMFSFNNGTVITPNSWAFWDYWSRNVLFIPVSNFEDGTLMTYNENFLTDASGNELASGTEINVEMIKTYYPRVTARPVSGSYEMPLRVDYDVTFVDKDGNTVPTDVYTEPVTLYSRVIPYNDFGYYFPYSSPAQREIYDDSVLMYYGIAENTYRWTDVDTRTYVRPIQAIPEKLELFHGFNKLIEKKGKMKDEITSVETKDSEVSKMEIPKDAVKIDSKKAEELKQEIKNNIADGSMKNTKDVETVLKKLDMIISDRSSGSGGEQTPEPDQFACKHTLGNIVPYNGGGLSGFLDVCHSYGGELIWQ